MALPEAHAEPAVQEGVCYALFAYDAGLAINLDESERRITALTQRAAIRHKRRAPRYFEYRPAPLRVTQEREVLAVGAFRTAPSVDAVLYDFGAVSVTYQIPLAGPLTRLITLAEELYESDVLRADSRRWVESLLAAIAPEAASMRIDEALVRRLLFHLLSNAFKFTSKGEVTVAVRPGEELGSAVVAVRDTRVSVAHRSVHGDEARHRHRAAIDREALLLPVKLGEQALQVRLARRGVEDVREEREALG